MIKTPNYLKETTRKRRLDDFAIVSMQKPPNFHKESSQNNIEAAHYLLLTVLVQDLYFELYHPQ
ncbi:MAG: hypothetical protein ACRDHZ_23315, partial [Ktedonobacteraceae bacterium]